MPLPLRPLIRAFTCLTVGAVLITGVVDAQPPGGREGGRGMFRMPLMTALDADGDGVISAKEIDEAPGHLRTLDANKDGKLTMEELRPAGGPGGRGRSGGNAGGGTGDEEMVNRLMEYDTDKDGTLKADDLPERLRTIVARADADKNGKVTRDELMAMNRGEGMQGRERGQRSEHDEHEHEEHEHDEDDEHEDDEHHEARGPARSGRRPAGEE